MPTFLQIAYNIIAPIFIIVATGVFLDRRLHIDPRPLSQTVIYLFTPFMVFDGIAKSDLSGAETGQLIVFSLAISVLMALAGWLVARLVRLDRRLVSGFVLGVTLINAGNYGIPLNGFAFGPEGEARAMIVFVITVAFSNTFGVFLASSGTVSTRQALRNTVSVPLPYAVVLGFVLNGLDVTLPTPLARATSLLAQASIPAMLTILGLQLSRAPLRVRDLRPVLLAVGMRLAVAPLIALPLLALLDMSGVTRQVALVEASMPSAVVGGVLATEFGGPKDSEFATSVILLSTALSMVSLTVILALVM